MTASLAGSWKLGAGSTSDTTCVTPGTEDLSGKLVTLSLAAPPANLKLESSIAALWPPVECSDLLALTVNDHTASITGATCMETDGASGQGTWIVTVAPYSLTLQLDDAGTKLTITGSQTVSNIHNGGGSCTATLTATATRP